MQDVQAQLYRSLIFVEHVEINLQCLYSPRCGLLRLAPQIQ